MVDNIVHKKDIIEDVMNIVTHSGKFFTVGSYNNDNDFNKSKSINSFNEKNGVLVSNFSYSHNIDEMIEFQTFL